MGKSSEQVVYQQGQIQMPRLVRRGRELEEAIRLSFAKELILKGL
jgi:hypothetical protein